MRPSGSNWKIKIKKMTEIVQCTIDDLEQYQSLARQTFFDTYEVGTDPKDLEKYIGENFSTEAITKELTEEPCAVFLLKKNNELLGYSKLRWDTTHELLVGKTIELQRIYVLKDQNGKGYGRMLMDHSEQYGREHGFDCIWLCVWFENHHAIRFYEKAGWEKFGMKDFKFGDEVYQDPVLRKNLV